MNRPPPGQTWTRQIPDSDHFDSDVRRRLRGVLRRICAIAENLDWPKEIAAQFGAVRANVMFPEVAAMRRAYGLPGRLAFVETHAPPGKYAYRPGELRNRYAAGEGISGSAFLKGRPFAECGRYGISQEKFDRIPASLLAVFGFPLRMSDSETPCGVVCVDILGEARRSIATPNARLDFQLPCNELDERLEGAIASMVGILRASRTHCMELRVSVRETVPRTVFLTHGHDHDLRDEVQRFLERANIPVTVLLKEPGHGETIIEKFERLSRTDFAIMLLTRDDVGFAHGTPREAAFRARQNVIMEIGFFAGLFGRDRVCCLVDTEVEMPSNLGGLETIDVHGKGGWKAPLRKRLRDAGFRC